MPDWVLIAEDKISTTLLCNIVVQPRYDNRIEVSAVDPVASMSAIKTRGFPVLLDKSVSCSSKVIAELHSIAGKAIGEQEIDLSQRLNSGFESQVACKISMIEDRYNDLASCTDFADPQHPYMYHGHILEHEDAGTMGQFVVV